MGLTRDHRIALVAAGEGDIFCPSVTHLFRSVADAVSSEAVGVLLSGMGRDGAEGLRRLREAGAVTIAQDAETSAVYGMPAEAVRLDAATLVLPPDGIVETIIALASGAEPQ
jgi:two-component system chemotaxis response regulator CheB